MKCCLGSAACLANASYRIVHRHLVRAISSGSCTARSGNHIAAFCRLTAHAHAPKRRVPPRREQASKVNSMHIPSDEWAIRFGWVGERSTVRTCRALDDQDIAMLLRRIGGRGTSGASRIATTAGMKSWPE